MRCKICGSSLRRDWSCPGCGAGQATSPRVRRNLRRRAIAEALGQTAFELGLSADVCHYRERTIERAGWTRGYARARANAERSR